MTRERQGSTGRAKKRLQRRDSVATELKMANREVGDTRETVK